MLSLCGRILPIPESSNGRDAHPIAKPRLPGRGEIRQCNLGAIIMASAVATIINDLRQRGGLKGTDVANIAAVSPATVSRWTSGASFPHPKTQLLISDLRYVVDRLAELYDPEETRVWLYSKHRLLNGQRAIDLIHAGNADEVLTIIESLNEGAYT
jgi:transcriptional regulator with XRE-family HTH domain